MLTWSTHGLTPFTSSLARLGHMSPMPTILPPAEVRRLGFRMSWTLSPDWRAARNGWRVKTPLLILGILKKTQFWYMVGNRNGNPVLLGVNLGLPPAKSLMLHLGLPNQVGQLECFGQWSPQSTILRTTLLRQDGGRGYDVVMTTSLSSDVPVGYFSWAEYDIMAPIQPKTQKAIAAAFISNCGARNFRLQALEALERESISIDSYGSCHRNKNGDVKKVDTLRHYKFSLAFENSNEEDYVTEKFFQSLVAGSVPVVVGAPNIQDFAPCPGSLLHIKKLEDVESVAKTMKHLAENPSAYNQTLRWKFEGPSDSFKALVDMSAVHSSCRLCIHLATSIYEREEKSTNFTKRPCKCLRGSETVYHVYVRERGRFNMESIFLRYSLAFIFSSGIFPNFGGVKFQIPDHQLFLIGQLI
ncbi:unnamed protein product [Cuscuta epithymum]|uniref:Fucosyltransferase n=1 Tax=Cuscuta epithymum TaxID=186058 RepID=A0AAV0ERA0_9ASTE|nr:unnamed protein product [Cuscuta epithymum]